MRFETPAAPVSSSAMARSLGLVSLLAPILGLAWLALPHDEDLPTIGIILLVAVPWTFAAVLLSGRLDHAPPLFFQILLFCCTLIVTPVVAWTAERNSSFVLFYLWGTPYAYCWFSLRHAALQTLFAGAAAFVAQLIANPVGGKPVSEMVGDSIILMGTIAVIGLVARRLMAGARHEERVRTERQRALAEFGREALVAPEREPLVDRALRLLVDVLGGEFAAAGAHERGSDTLCITNVLGPPDMQLMRAGTRLPAGDGSLMAAAMRHGQAIITDEHESDPSVSLTPVVTGAYGVRSGLAAAIRGTTGAPLGAIGVYSTHPARFARADVAFVQSLANLVAAAWRGFAADEELRRLAMHDPLTGLPNRTLLADRLDQALARARRDSGHVAVILIDLDRFKHVNDSLGHPAGDALLSELALRLRAACRSSDTLARLGGDEFVLVAEAVRDADHALDIAQRLATAWTAPIPVLGRELHVDASTGVAISHPDSTGEALLANADAAMYRAKALGSGMTRLYDVGLRERATRQLDIEHELRRALERDELRVHYQPIVDPRTGAPTSLEALVRWQHPERGLLTPGEFILAAEQTGLMIPLGLVVLGTAVRQLAAWRAAGHDRLQVTVNVSVLQLRRPGLVEEVRDVLAEHGVPPEAVAIEITEHAALLPHGPGARTARALSDLGVELALDDFGSGYSSLSTLRVLPMKALKLDRAIVAGVGVDVADTGIVSGIVRMACDAGLTVVAEGVETAEQAARLVEMDCPRAQGFYYARPMDAERATEFLRAAAAAAPAG
jgi:diguanylate cyclase (GGDEF)-like protein